MINPDRIADDLGRETIAGVTRAIALHGTSVSSVVRKLTIPIDELEKEIAVLARQQPDWEIFDSLPGAGTTVDGRLGITPRAL
jgi:hypothetical protein